MAQKNNFTDAQRLDLLERHHTLHKKIDILYVVVGYEATVLWDEQPISKTFAGETLRDVLDQMLESGDSFDYKENIDPDLNASATNGQKD